MTYERRRAANLRKKLAHLSTTDIDHMAKMIATAGKGQFTKKTALDWLRSAEDGQELMSYLSKKENVHG